MAFGARATARRRGLILNVCRRGSYGAAGPSPEVYLTDDSHDFLSVTQPLPLEQSARQHRRVCLRERLTLTIKPLTIEHAGLPPDSPARRRATTRSGSSPRHAPAPPLLLLVRTTRDHIGDIPLELSESPPITVHASPDLVGSVLPAGTHEVDVAEWRLDSEVEPMPHLPWEAFPAAVKAITDWVIEQAGGDRERVVLLATRVPQELPVGLGIQLGLRASKWPKHVYPVHFAGGRLVVPNLRLGATSVPAERA
jgi:hypothetical protein